jgi:DNA-binding transcriptional LysR family regulator
MADMAATDKAVAARRTFDMDAKVDMGADRARALEIFAAVMREGSFSAAGRILGLTPSAVARSIDRIEARLGVRLLLRSTRALTPTAEGQAYLQTARRILADLDDAEQQLADQGAPRGRLRISAALSHGRLRIVPLLGAFAALYPHILIDFALSDGIVDIAAGQADVAIRFGALADSLLTARKLGESGRMIVAAPGYMVRRSFPRTSTDTTASTSTSAVPSRSGRSAGTARTSSCRLRGTSKRTMAKPSASSRSRALVWHVSALSASSTISQPGVWFPFWRTSIPVTSNSSTPYSSVVARPPHAFARSSTSCPSILQIDCRM